MRYSRPILADLLAVRCSALRVAADSPNSRFTAVVSEVNTKNQYHWAGRWMSVPFRNQEFLVA